ncbi:XdhC family protein [Heyndrickxia sporothermodurans]|uniref:XdhC family protein n=1 Tax=Heyndrickxia sporothermodurans TaxID=46224 RepID=UPI0035E2C096
MDDIFQILSKLSLIKGKSVLATIIHVEGSAYKKEGSCMLIADDGSQIGMLSAGCLEEDLRWKAEQVFLDGTARIFTYDMKDETDLAWGQGAGCNGILHILLEPINQLLMENLFMLKTCLDEGDSVLQIKQFDNDFNLVSTSFFSEKGKTFGDKCPYSIEVNDFIQSGLMTIENLSPAFIHLFKPKPRLVLFGAGEDAKPLVHIADYTGFNVILCDWRPSLCNKENFPRAQKIIQGFPQEIYEKINLTQQDFVVIMSHHFQRDKEFLSLIKNDKLSFLGILGPKKRTVRLLDGTEIPPWISSPVGMDIGSKGAEEIAISIVAEMIKVLRKRTTVGSP